MSIYNAQASAIWGELRKARSELAWAKLRQQEAKAKATTEHSDSASSTEAPTGPRESAREQEGAREEANEQASARARESESARESSSAGEGEGERPMVVWEDVPGTTTHTQASETCFKQTLQPKFVLTSMHTALFVQK